jgi:hypothetical protein
MPAGQLLLGKLVRLIIYSFRLHCSFIQSQSTKQARPESVSANSLDSPVSMVIIVKYGRKNFLIQRPTVADVILNFIIQIKLSGSITDQWRIEFW